MRVEPGKSKGAQTKVYPVFLPSPSSSADSHAQFWRTCYRAILQSLIPDLVDPPPAQHSHLRNAFAKCEAKAPVVVASFGPATEAGRVALYKDANSLTWQLPVAGLTPKHAERAVAELDSLHGALHSAWRTKGARRPEIGAALANSAGSTEARLRQNFEKFVDTLATNQPNALQRWRREAKECLADAIHEAGDATARASPLRRREQHVKLASSLDRAIARMTNGTSKEANYESK